MIFLLIILIGFPLLGWVLGKGAGDALFPDDDYSIKPYRSGKEVTNITNHITHNHLHVDGETFTSITNLDSPSDLDDFQ